MPRNEKKAHSALLTLAVGASTAAFGVHFLRGDTSSDAFVAAAPGLRGAPQPSQVSIDELREGPAAFLGDATQQAPMNSSSSALFAGAAALAGAFAAAGTAGKRRSRSGKAAAVAAKALCKESEPSDSIRRRFEEVVTNAQESICSAIEKVDGGAKFSKEVYARPGGEPGGGIARVMAGGNVFEKAGCNLSVVYGEMPVEALKAANDRGVDRIGAELKPGQKVPFYACGLSSVMHPRNPHCPTMHFNYRYFETDFGVWWFGGGTDITPSYLDEDDMRHFHGTYKKVCDKFDPTWYPKMKEWADDYFLIAHRGETRGMGGIFFDDFNTEKKERHLDFAKQCLDAVSEAYVPILEKHKNDSFTPEQKEWQQIRRGRYVEFNLVYDRGTVFGLKMLGSGVGRTESILMSLPETARWEYCHEPKEGSEEAKILEIFRNPRDWA